MSGFTHNFKQYINLPTGGLEYSSACWGSPITSEIILLEYDPQTSLSYFEYITTIIRRYFELPTDILNMYICDIYYIWTGAQVSDLQKSDEYKLIHTCDNCNTENTVLLHFGEMEVITVNPYNNDIKSSFTLMSDTYLIEFERRKVKNNLDYGYLALQLQDQLSYLMHYICYLMTQTTNIIYEGKKVDKKEWLDFYLSLLSNSIIRIFEQVKAFNSEIGMQTASEYICPKCKTYHEIEVYNDFVESLVGMKPHDDTLDMKKIEMYKQNLQMLQLNMTNISELQTIPFKDIETFGQALSNIELKPKLI